MSSEEDHRQRALRYLTMAQTLVIRTSRMASGYWPLHIWKWPRNR